jgi:hypothetical protein
VNIVSEADKAEALYVKGLADGAADVDWEEAVLHARRQVLNAMRSSNYLHDIGSCLAEAGEHLTVFRHMFGPPISQDQFALICPEYRKTWERPGRSVPPTASETVATAVKALIDRKLARWIDQDRKPSLRELRILVATVAPMLSLQSVSTVRRNRMSATQEGAVISLLEEMGWIQISSGIVEQSSVLPAAHFMHKTKFATKTRPQEVDIACGLGKSVVLAMECKVTNDRTNSVKRVNDILKKATAWQEHWGSFVRTAALLQGVIADKDVERLNAANVHVFWSHDLDTFGRWLKTSSSE